PAENPPAAVPSEPGVVEVNGANLELRVEATEPVAFSFSADGGTASTVSLEAGRYRTVRAASSILFETDDAKPLLLTLNGEIQPPLGAKGEKKKVTYRLRKP